MDILKYKLINIIKASTVMQNMKAAYSNTGKWGKEYWKQVLHTQQTKIVQKYYVKKNQSNLDKLWIFRVIIGS
jgi:hypothetical protein